jgi:hypothetical protein
MKAYQAGLVVACGWQALPARWPAVAAPRRDRIGEGERDRSGFKLNFS